MPYYKKLVERVKNDKTAHLVFWAQAPHPIKPLIEVKKVNQTGPDRAANLEHQLLLHIANTLVCEPQRVSFLIEDKEVHFSSIDPQLMRMPHLPDMTQMIASNGPHAYYSTDLSIAYHKWTEDSPICMRYSPGSKAAVIDDKDYIMFTIPKELRKIMHRLFFNGVEVSLNGRERWLHDGQRDASSVELIGHGTLLARCVLENTTAIALTLGIPLQNIEISLEQNEYWRPDGWLNYHHISPDQLSHPFRQNIGTIGRRLAGHWELFPDVTRA